ncbi:hypothetical protein C1Y31_27875 [Pseudomonas sp. FW305-25]|nr:hypothetical protein C1Y31_27875 [Pseudomonas sp. FW305-25]PMY62562.1 hypothetical protein C1Y32_27845 [Pseudomonas sp. FW126-L8]PNA73691.1 hypothetical protein C1Y33_26500 [Pseudomonas sp. FW305-76]
MPAMDVNDDAVCLEQRGASDSIASKLRSYKGHSNFVAAAEGCDPDRRARKASRSLKAFGLIAACGSGYRSPLQIRGEH